jgi:ribosome assembly protein 3
MPPPNKPGPGKRRIRKRKRRQAASSSSSSSSDSESDSQNAQKFTASPAALPTAPAEDRSEQSSLSDSSSTSSASDAESVRDGGDARMQSPHTRRPQNRSPSPPDPTIPPLVTLNPTTDEEKQRDAQLREKFRKFWMASVADAFSDDLEKIQKVWRVRFLIYRGH